MPPIAQRRLLLAEGHVAWQPTTLHGMLDGAALAHGDDPFVVTDDQSWTYSEVANWSLRIAGGLRRLGVGPGDRVAVIMANYPEFAPLKFAISRVGAVAVPINMLNRRDELRYLLEQSEARLLVTMACFRGNDYLAALDELACGWDGRPGAAGGGSLPRLAHVVVFDAGEGTPRGLGFSELDGEPADLPPVNPVELCDIIYTSGTTGAPKGVLLTHDMVTRTAFGAAYARAFAPGHRIIFSLPMYHVFGYVEGLLAVPWVGGSIVPQLRFDPHATLAAIERHRATDVLLIPTMSLALVDAARERRYDLSSLHFALASGGRAPERLWSELRDMGIAEITTGYGMTETTATTMITRPDDSFARLRGSNGRPRDVGPVGDSALGGRLVVYRVIDPETGAERPCGEIGELVARGPGVTPGYWRKPEATAAAFTPDGWFRTGDLGRLDEEGYLQLVGRTKESYRCGGELVMPTEVEDALTRHPDVMQAHVVPVPDERMGEVGVAFVVARPDVAIDAEALRRMLVETLARHKTPRHVLLVGEEEIPTTASGRARKFMLSAKAIAMLELQ